MATDGPSHRPCLIALGVALLCALVPASARAGVVVFPNGPVPLWSDTQPTEVTVRAAIDVTGGAFVADYGPTTSYGKTAAATVLGVDPETGGTLASAKITGLAPGTTYHWRMRRTDISQATADQTVTTSPAGAPTLEAPPTAAYSGTGPSVACSPGAWSDENATMSYVWANDTSSPVFTPVRVEAPLLTYATAGRYRCAVTARNAAGASSASVLFQAGADRIPVRVLVRPSVRLDEERNALCNGWMFYGGSGPATITTRWLRAGAVIATADTLALGPYTPATGVSCQVTYTRSGQTRVATSDPYLGDEGNLLPPPVAGDPAAGAVAAVTHPGSRPVVTSSGEVLSMDTAAATTDDGVTLDDARLYSREALADEFGKRYAKRKNFKMTCTARSVQRIRCGVSWRYKGLYTGDVWIVIPRNPSSPIVVSVEVSKPKKKLKRRWASDKDLRDLIG